MSRQFKRVIEDFVCEHCNQKIKGNGYTNHCSACLWSKHVDNKPGDRASNCCGLMEPIRVELEKQDYYLVFRCQKCGVEKRNKVQKADDFNKVIEINKKQNKILEIGY